MGREGVTTRKKKEMCVGEKLLVVLMTGVSSDEWGSGVRHC